MNSLSVLLVALVSVVNCQKPGPVGRPPCAPGQSCQPKGHCPVICPTGPPGIPGVKGDPGDMGEKGHPGIPGLKGDPGDMGEKGLPGIPGLKGDPGDMGEKGHPGIPGVKGDPGDMGEKGLPGIPGVKGDAGDMGEKGFPGIPGVKGDPGDMGEKGFPGIPGAKGHKGVPGVVGMKGDPGYPGQQGMQGLPGPPGSPGKDGAGTLNRRKPSINLDGKQHRNQLLQSSTDLDIWSYTGSDGHVLNMTYAKGKVTVQVSGMYFIFAQLYYNPPTITARHFIMVNGNVVALGHGQVNRKWPQTIYTSALRYLNVGDKITVQVAYSANVWTGRSHSFFGAYMI